MSYVYKTRGEQLAEKHASERFPAIMNRSVIAQGIADVYRAPVFTGGFRSYVCFGDSIETHYNGFRVSAHIEQDLDKTIDDDDCHNKDQSVTGCTDEQHAQLLRARAAYFRDEWHYCGVVLSVTRNGVMLDEHAASLWGIECNYPGGDNSYLTVVAQELLPEALKAAQTVLDLLVQDVTP